MSKGFFLKFDFCPKCKGIRKVDEKCLCNSFEKEIKEKVSKLLKNDYIIRKGVDKIG